MIQQRRRSAQEQTGRFSADKSFILHQNLPCLSIESVSELLLVVVVVVANGRHKRQSTRPRNSFPFDVFLTLCTVINYNRPASKFLPNTASSVWAEPPERSCPKKESWDFGRVSMPPGCVRLLTPLCVWDSTNPSRLPLVPVPPMPPLSRNSWLGPPPGPWDLWQEVCIYDCIEIKRIKSNHAE